MNFKIFEEESFYEVCRNNKDKAINYINKQEEDYLLNVNEQDLINSIFDKFSYNQLIFHFDKSYLSEEKEGYQNYHVFVINGLNNDEKEYYSYNIPFEGSPELLKCQPSRCSLYFRKCSIYRNEIKFKILKRDSNYINKEIEEINQIENNRIVLNKEVDIHNQNLKGIIENVIKSRKKDIINKRNDLNNLNIPLKTKNSSSTYSVKPVVKKETPIIKEHIIKENTINPTIDEILYDNILEVINNKCKTFEKTPTFNQFGEEGLRDMIVSDLSTHFDASTTGESFNKNGKTDILIKYNNENLFIGECKFWKGIKQFYETINQLLGYITWRDTKTAIILFVDRKDISNVLKEIKNKISSHENYIKEIKNDKEWLEYEFHIDSDDGINFKLAILISHIPK